MSCFSSASSSISPKPSSWWEYPDEIIRENSDSLNECKSDSRSAMESHSFSREIPQESESINERCNRQPFEVTWEPCTAVTADSHGEVH